jgi:hypothetical protein
VRLVNLEGRSFEGHVYSVIIVRLAVKTARGVHTCDGVDTYHTPVNLAPQHHHNIHQNSYGTVEKDINYYIMMSRLFFLLPSSPKQREHQGLKSEVVTV